MVYEFPWRTGNTWGNYNKKSVQINLLLFQTNPSQETSNRSWLLQLLSLALPFSATAWVLTLVSLSDSSPWLLAVVVDFSFCTFFFSFHHIRPPPNNSERVLGTIQYHSTCMCYLLGSFFAPPITILQRNLKATWHSCVSWGGAPLQGPWDFSVILNQ